jgi:hypothetical protein
VVLGGAQLLHWPLTQVWPSGQQTGGLPVAVHSCCCLQQVPSLKAV